MDAEQSKRSLAALAPFTSFQVTLIAGLGLSLNAKLPSVVSHAGETRPYASVSTSPLCRQGMALARVSATLKRSRCARSSGHAQPAPSSTPNNRPAS
jgi:hypothetical protein